MMRKFIITRSHDVIAQGARQRNRRLRSHRNDDDKALRPVFDQAVFEVWTLGHESLYTTLASFSTLVTSMM